MHYRICGELHFDFLKSPSSQIFPLNLMVFKAVAEGKCWLSHWVSAGFSTLLPSLQSPVSPTVAVRRHQVISPGGKLIGSHLGNKVPICHPGEGETSFCFPRGTNSHRGGLCSGVPTRGLSWDHASQLSILG